jgi:hypothetical protein
MVTVNRGDEEERADAFVEIRLALAVGGELGASREELVGGTAGAPAVDGEVARGVVARVDEVSDA